MTNLQKRLQKLEVGQTTDDGGFVSYSDQWFQYWTRWLQQLTEGVKPPGKIPLEALRAITLCTQQQCDSSF
jgi:hypothetical protein